jgi:hypothetical protein
MSVGRRALRHLAAGLAVLLVGGLAPAVAGTLADELQGLLAEHPQIEADRHPITPRHGITSRWRHRNAAGLPPKNPS